MPITAAQSLANFNNLINANYETIKTALDTLLLSEDYTIDTENSHLIYTYSIAGMCKSQEEFALYISRINTDYVVNGEWLDHSLACNYQIVLKTVITP